MLCLELGSQLLPIPVDVFSRQKERVLPRSDADGVNEHVVFENAAHDDFVLSHKDGVSLAVTSPDQVSGLWQAIQDTEVRFVRGRGTAVAPPGGVYYEVSLTSADGASVYGFGCNSNEDLVIQGSAYVIVGESQILQALDALFPDSAE